MKETAIVAILLIVFYTAIDLRNLRRENEQHHKVQTELGKRIDNLEKKTAFVDHEIARLLER